MTRKAAALKEELKDLNKDFDSALQKIRILENVLRECMRYVESTDGTKGDLVGCAVHRIEYVQWVRLTKNIS
jgi:hypothetical protein